MATWGYQGGMRGAQATLLTVEVSLPLGMAEGPKALWKAPSIPQSGGLS